MSLPTKRIKPNSPIVRPARVPKLPKLRRTAAALPAARIPAAATAAATVLCGAGTGALLSTGAAGPLTVSPGATDAGNRYNFRREFPEILKSLTSCT